MVWRKIEWIAVLAWVGGCSSRVTVGVAEGDGNAEASGSGDATSGVIPVGDTGAASGGESSAAHDDAASTAST